MRTRINLPIVSPWHWWQKRREQKLLDEAFRLELWNRSRPPDLDTLAALLQAGASVDGRPSPDWCIPLAIAARNPVCTVETVRFLLENGADIGLLNGKRLPNVPPLVWAAHGAGRDANAKFHLLFAAGANANACDKWKEEINRTVLWEMMEWASIELIEEVLQRGANPNRGGFGGRKVLHLAALDGWADVVPLLLRYGADPLSRDDDGQTPRTLAEKEEIVYFGKIVLRNRFDLRHDDHSTCAGLLRAAEQEAEQAIR